MDYKIEVREIEPIRVAYLSYRGIATEANKVFPKVFQAIMGKANGAPFFSYLEMNPETKMGVILRGNPDKYITEILFPIKED